MFRLPKALLLLLFAIVPTFKNMKSVSPMILLLLLLSLLSISSRYHSIHSFLLVPPMKQPSYHATSCHNIIKPFDKVIRISLPMITNHNDNDMTNDDVVTKNEGINDMSKEVSMYSSSTFLTKRQTNHNISIGPNNENKQVTITRRNLLYSSGLGIASSNILLRQNDNDNMMAYGVAGPITVKEMNTFNEKLLLYFSPKPILVLRQRIDIQFAILFMRTSYTITDTLDFIPMNQFQRDFFLLRSNQYELYIKQLNGNAIVQQGDLSDPYYFDFISYAQYKTINRAITSNPSMIFEELQPISNDDDDNNNGQDSINDASSSSVVQRFRKVIVQRDSTITNDRLVEEHDRRVGMNILQYLEETFNSNPNTALPSLSVSTEDRTNSIQILHNGLEQLIKLFVICGYAFNGNVERIDLSNSKDSSTKFILTLMSPSNLWSGQSLQYYHCPLLNDFLLKTTKVYIKERFGYNIVSSNVKYENYNEINTINII